MDLLHIKMLMEFVNDLVKLCSALMLHKRTGNQILEGFRRKTDILMQTTKELKVDTKIGAKLPIATKPSNQLITFGQYVT